MSTWIFAERYQLRILETPQEMTAVEDVQRRVWPGNETDIIPGHVLITLAKNGGLVIGAYDLRAAYPPEPPDGVPIAQLVGVLFGFPGLYETPEGLRLKHCSHMLGVHPLYRDQGLGYVLKRAQWQMVRHQGIDLITWTYDPLLSRNGHLNIHRLGAVCNTYHRQAYGEMQDDLNIGLPSDRFQVDWWVESPRVFQRLSKQPRARLDLAHFLAAGSPILNPSQVSQKGLPLPAPEPAITYQPDPQQSPIVLVEIPADFLSLKAADMQLALEWRLHTRAMFESLFEQGYLVTDFVFLAGSSPRSFYALSYGDSTLLGVNKNISEENT